MSTSSLVFLRSTQISKVCFSTFSLLDLLVKFIFIATWHS